MRLAPAEATVWAITDNLGSVVAVVQDGGGNGILDSVVYDSYGNIVSQTNPADAMSVGFTGYQYDAETGLYYGNARYYSPHLGRFISEDPSGFAAGDSNLYRYVDNHPTYSTDPTGLYEGGSTGSSGSDNSAFNAAINEFQTGIGPISSGTGGYSGLGGGSGNASSIGSVNGNAIDFNLGGGPSLASGSFLPTSLSPSGYSVPLPASMQIIAAGAVDLGTGPTSSLAAAQWYAAGQSSFTGVVAAAVGATLQQAQNGAEYVGYGLEALGQHPSALGPGSLQGLANAANGVQNLGIGLVNTPGDFANFVGNLAGDGSLAPLVPSPDWSNNLVVQNDPAHAISVALGGQAAASLATLGTSQWLSAAENTTLEHLQGAATRAAQTVGDGSGSVYGTAVHGAFKAEVQALDNPSLFSEQSYLNGVPVKYGTPGSIRIDVGEGTVEDPTAVYDLKTGGARLSPARIQQIQMHLPSGTGVPVYEVRP